jgi:hypothetical protein
MFINGREDTGCGEPLLGNIMVKEADKPTSVRTISIPDGIPPENFTSPTGQQFRFLEGLIPALMLILAIVVLIILHRTNK